MYFSTWTMFGGFSCLSHTFTFLFPFHEAQPAMSVAFNHPQLGD